MSRVTGDLQAKLDILVSTLICLIAVRSNRVAENAAFQRRISQ